MMPLAAGGMARIYIGRSTGIGSFERHVVLKLILPERANDTNAVQMFLDEARLAASLNHQNVAQVFEVGEDVGIHYLAMEYVHGQDLRALLAKAGSQGTRVPLELALTVVAGAAAGLHHAHERRGQDGVSLGIVHRDVSPSNIMIGYDGAVKLLDFGIAKAAARSIETQSGIIKGKFAYMAPEQCRGREVDPRSDVFSLGIILYEISTQHRCFRADSDFDTMHRIVTGDVVRPTRLVQGYPQALEAIVMKALAVDPAQRYQSAGQLLEALESFSVAARMSLSTMALGRFMREMFGEVSEPWLTSSGRHMPPIEAKEGTISNTDSSREGQRRPPTTLTPTNQGEGQLQQEIQQARTILDLPRGSDAGDFEEAGVEWNAKSYPTMEPAYASTDTLPPDAMEAVVASRPSRPEMVQTPRSSAQMPAVRASNPQIARTSSASVPVPRITNPQMAAAEEPELLAAPVGSQPLQPVPTGQFGTQPASSSSPALVVASQSGFAPADISYPRYEPPPDVDDVRITSRWPLVLGILIVVVGLAAVLVIAFWDFGDKQAELAGQPEPPKPEPTAAGAPAKPAEADVKPIDPPPVDKPVPDKAVAEKPAPDKAVADKPAVDPKPSDTPKDPPANVVPTPAPVVDTPDDPMFSVHVESIPSGADVLIDAKTVGTTPLDLKLKRRQGSATLVVHRPHFKDEVSKLDFTSTDFTKKVTLKKLVDEPAPKSPTPTKAPPVVHPTPRTDPPKADPPKVPSLAPRQDCQPQGQVDPFDTRPTCK